MKRMFSKEELEAIIKNVTDIDEVKEDIDDIKEELTDINTDITPVLLWENATPNVEFAEATITIEDSSNFKYLVIENKMNQYQGTSGGQYLKFKNENNKSKFICYVDDLGATYQRAITIISNTSIQIKAGYYNGSQDNNTCIPLAIYGTNIL